MKRIKILYCIDCLVRGGTELQLSGLIERLDRSAYEPFLLTIRPTDPGLVPPDCRHLAWHVPKLFSLAALRSVHRLVRFLRGERIDIVQTFFQDSTILAGFAALIAGIRVRIASFRDMGFWSTRLQVLAMRAVYTSMDAFISNTMVVGDHFARVFGVDRQRVRVIPNGVDVAAFRFASPPEEVTDIGIVANMTRAVKRVDLFVRAAGALAPRYPSIRWHIVGDGEMRGELESLAAELGVLDRMVFAGRVADVPCYLERLQIGAVCSDSEGLSNALIEYMFKGVASVATRVGGNPELIVDGETGLLVPPGDARALAEAIGRLIADRQLRTGIARAARARVMEAYSWERCLAAHDDFYRSLLGDGLDAHTAR